VHIISLDNHRVGAPAQIKAFAQMMGVPVTIVRHAPTELPEALEQSANAELVLVDTAGRSLQDLRAPRMLEQLMNRLPKPEIHLAIAAGTSAFDIDTIVARYAPIGVSHLLFTKVDETADLRELVLAPARHNIPVGFLTCGQKVPEDIQLATRKLLMSMAIEGQEFMEVA
jgi:flagellar biosynthesis protein FlhF